MRRSELDQFEDEYPDDFPEEIPGLDDDFNNQESFDRHADLIERLDRIEALIEKLGKK